MLKVIQKLKIGSAIGLGVVGLATIPSLSPAYAESNTATMDLNANIAAAGLSVTLGISSTTLNLAPPYTGYTNQSSQVKVEVGSYDSYKLYMTGSTNLVNQSDNTKVIRPISTTCNTLNSNAGCLANDDANFTNAWGYSVGQTDPGKYKGLYGYSVVGSRTTSTQEQIPDTYYVNFITKVDHSVTPGTYTGTINFIALADTTKLIMQDVTSTTCTNDVQTVYDIRDGKSYHIQKLADNNCWMLDNLALDPTDELTKANINEYTTNADANSVAAFKVGAANAEIDNASTQYAKAGVSEWVPETPGVFDEPWVWTTIADHKMTTADGAQAPSSNQAADNQVGVYYNYCAASLGSYCYGNGTDATGSPSINTNGARAIKSDICPKGWALPTGGTNGQFQALYTEYDSNVATFRQAFAIPLSGLVYFNGGTIVDFGNYARWWSSSMSNATLPYVLYASSTTMNPAYGGNDRLYGFTVRCILQ